MSIFHKYLLFTLPFIILSIIVTGVILSWTSYRYFKKTIAQDYTNIIKSSSGEIRLFMGQAQKGLETLARVLAAVKPDAWQETIALTAFNHENDQFRSVSLLSPTGDTLATTRWADEDIAACDREVFQKALEGRSGVSGVRLTEDRLPFVHMAVPLTALGRVKAILWAVVDLKYIWDLLEGIRIGRFGQVYILDLSGRYIAHREIDKVASARPAQKPDILADVKQSVSPVSWTEKDDGVQFFCLGSCVEDFDWVIVLRQPLSEIYQYLFENIFLAVLMIASICLVSIMVGYFQIKRFTAPIETMHRQVLKIGEGDLTQKVSVTSADEIGELAYAFNNMTRSLKEVIKREVQTAKDLAHARNLAVLGTTAGKVTHEVGNLLNNIAMAIRTLKGEALGLRGKKALGIMEKESDRVRAFIRNFLQFAKMPDLHFEKTVLDIIVQEAMDAHRPAAETQGVAFAFQWPQHAPLIHADARLMYQVFNNLINNSLEALPRSGTVRIEGAIENGHLIVSVADSGTGMEPEAVERIFDPFFTTKKQGTGLGLAIVKTIVAAHRGTIACSSTPGRGTRFDLRLPLN